jgi:hypothetical protein
MTADRQVLDLAESLEEAARTFERATTTLVIKSSSVYYGALPCSPDSLTQTLTHA